MLATLTDSWYKERLQLDVSKPRVTQRSTVLLVTPRLRLL